MREIDALERDRDVLYDAILYGIADDEPDDTHTRYGCWRCIAREAIGKIAREAKP